MQIELTAADGHRFSAWQDGPADATRALVIVQEIFGVNSHMRHVCETYARQGFAVVSPALFDRAERGVDRVGQAFLLADPGRQPTGIAGGAIEVNSAWP